ncbi:TolC family protein [Sphingobacterium shayense]|uniref:TolC family protein n=1 Tax=Sphingobacterium shayense TaxID=626343 RepID=UPI00155530EB|nr:TolC family protein [Sphingobacterium shayense]
MKYIYIFLFYVAEALGTTASAQSYNLVQLEEDFLTNNYMLIAAKYNIAVAEATVVQEKLWPNPTLSIDEVNLWANRGSEVLPPLAGSYGRHQQISVELQQLVETAGKRNKRIAISKLETRAAIAEFEALVRELKRDLRQTYYRALRQKHDQIQLDTVVALFEQLSTQYARQAKLKNVSYSAYQRIQAELINLRGERAVLEEDITRSIHMLATLTTRQDITIDKLEDGDAFRSRTSRVPAELEVLAAEGNTTLLQKKIAVEIAQGELSLEKANAKPDLTLQLGYDRGGNIMQDFVGLGISMDLPVFNRNRGNIQAARESIKMGKVNQASARWALESEVKKNRDLLQKYEQTLVSLSAESIDEQQEMIGKYKKHLQNKQITLIEFIDFVEAIRQADRTMLTVWENYNNTYEELQYLSGNDF